MKIIIIEDERLTAKHLAKTIQAIDAEIEILAMLGSVEEAVEFLRRKPVVDLIFSDIELGDGLSFEIFERSHTRTPIIFCTAYDKYALDAFKTLGIDYILKPFSKMAIDKAITKYRDIHSPKAETHHEYADILATLKSQMYHKPPSVIVYQGDKIIPISSTEIAVFMVKHDTTIAYTFDNKTYPVSQNMETLEHLLSPYFFRANRQYLVNRKAVKDAAQYFNRKIAVNLTLDIGGQILVGKLKTKALLEWLAAQ
jgi:two-component system, LytTR family, response regulator LytT